MTLAPLNDPRMKKHHSARESFATIEVSDFDLDLTLGCGQVFHWVKEGAGYLGAIGNRAVYVEQCGGKLLAPAGCEKIVADYFALDHPMEEIYRSFPGDPAMCEALHFCRGMRIIRQPGWECVATFITSSMKQVAHIAQMSHSIRARFGPRLQWDGREVFGYPEPKQIAALDEAALRACSLGYRAKNLLATARLLADGRADLESIAEMDDESAHAALCRFPGVGTKVANCALLFGFERSKAFPIDVWIERVLRETYFREKRKVTQRRLRDFSASYFGDYGGYAQQYLFHHARKTWRREERKRLTSAQGRSKLHAE